MTSTALRQKGILAASASAFFLGLTPIFGKQAILSGFSPFAVVAIRTTLALLLLFVFLLIFKRGFFFIHGLGLIGCLIAGVVNGVGSIFYYTALSRIDAGVGQLLYSFYPLLMVLWMILDRQSISRITIGRLVLVIPGAFLLLDSPQQKVDVLGAVFMIIAALLYSLHMLINQRVLYEVPAPTVTFYTLLSMSLTVGAAYFIFDAQIPTAGVSWAPLLWLAVFTFLSRVTLFMGVKHIGSMQTALLGLGEILVTVVLAQIFLAENLNGVQWIGAILILLNLVLVIFDRSKPKPRTGKGFLSWLYPPAINPIDPLL